MALGGPADDPCPYLPADAFEDAAQQEETTSGVDYVHIRVQQRNGKKSLTTVQASPLAEADVLGTGHALLNTLFTFVGSEEVI